jgi:hypothetical protein
MSRWSLLFAQVDALDLSGRRALSSAAEFEAWSDFAERALLEELQRIAELRAAELRELTDVRVAVSRLEPGPDLSARGVRVGVLELGLGAARVYVYSVRERGQSPAVHFALRRESAFTRHPVLASLPGCLVVRSESGAAELLALPRPLGDCTEPRPTPDDLVFRAFELVVAAHRGTRPEPLPGRPASGHRSNTESLA